mmetsp:Transcript_15173/g.39051  ORF Transcript_15173/g.39051 Transcript_15173/m.39051 type:complete len:564 (+) Transcript_15173:268-1959(+)
MAGGGGGRPGRLEDIRHDPDTNRWRCPHCPHEFSRRDKVVDHLKLNKNGKFKCKEKARKAEVAKRSFLASMEGDEIRRASKQARAGEPSEHSAPQARPHSPEPTPSAPIPATQSPDRTPRAPEHAAEGDAEAAAGPSSTAGGRSGAEPARAEAEGRDLTGRLKGILSEIKDGFPGLASSVAEEGFVKRLVFLESELRAGRGFPKEHFPFLHGKAAPSKKKGTHSPHPGTRLEHLERGQFIGVDLNIELLDGGSTDSSDDSESNSSSSDASATPRNAETHDSQCTSRAAVQRSSRAKQALNSIGYDVADWCANVVHHFTRRFESNPAKAMIKRMAQCVDLRMFVRTSHVPYASFEAFLDGQVGPNLRAIHDWMVQKGQIKLAEFDECYSQCKALALKMNADVKAFKCEHPQVKHRWHDDKDGLETVSGTVIQAEIMTVPAFYKLCPGFMYMYVHCVLKICNEAVVEGMCSVVAKHATGTRGLIFDMYAKESIVDYNAPHRAHSTPFITKALDHYFGQKTYQRVKPVDKWRFLRTDNNLWRNASLLSEMLTNRLTETSRLEFMNH